MENNVIILEVPKNIFVSWPGVKLSPISSQTNFSDNTYFLTHTLLIEKNIFTWPPSNSQVIWSSFISLIRYAFIGSELPKHFEYRLRSSIRNLTIHYEKKEAVVKKKGN